MILHMQVLIELDPETLRQLEAVAPARSRKRSAFIRAAVRKALWELEEEKTRRAYATDPDDEPAPFEPSAWEPLAFGGFDPPTSVRRVERAPKRRARPKRKLDR